MRFVSTRPEGLLFIAMLALANLAAWGPTVQQTLLPHDLADTRRLLGIDNALNVVSNLPLAFAAVAGGWTLWRAPAGAVSNMQRAMSLLFFCGAALLSHGASLYHFDPQLRFLAGERYAMAFVLAGLVGLAGAGHVSERAGASLGLGSLALGVLAVRVLGAGGNLFPWTVFQFGAIVLVWCMAVAPPRLHALPITWTMVLLAFALSTLLGAHDHAIFAATHGWVSGETLAHLATSFLVWPVVSGIAQASQWQRDSALDPFMDDALQRLIARCAPARPASSAVAGS